MKMNEAIAALNERGKLLEELANYALSVRLENTPEWMRGFAEHINDVLASDGDPRRCIFDGDSLILREREQLPALEPYFKTQG